MRRRAAPRVVLHCVPMPKVLRVSTMLNGSAVGLYSIVAPDILYCVRCEVEPTCTAATYERTAALYLQADYSSWSRLHYRRVESSPRKWHMHCTRTRRHGAPRSSVDAGRCQGRTWWTSCRSGWRMSLSRRCPSTRPPAACTCLPRIVLWTYCTQRSTSCCCYVTASRTSTCSGRSESGNLAAHCPASSCL